MSATLSKADAYKILGLENDAPRTEVSIAVRRALMKHHPDRGGDRNIFEQICAARNLLLPYICPDCNGTKEVREKIGRMTKVTACKRCK